MKHLRFGYEIDGTMAGYISSVSTTRVSNMISVIMDESNINANEGKLQLHLIGTLDQENGGELYHDVLGVVDISPRHALISYNEYTNSLGVIMTTIHTSCKGVDFKEVS